MYLNRLHLLNFKNYAEAEVTLSSKINCLVGPNGAGKTNVLDAIYYLSFLKSYLNNTDQLNVHHGQDFFVVEGWFDRDGHEEHIYCAVHKEQKKKARRNKKEYERMQDHIGLLPLVIISPYDKDLISEGSALRRKFMDSVISQYDAEYLDQLVRYKRILDQRNSLLKYFAQNRSFDKDTLEVYNHQMVELSNAIYPKRKAFIESFVPLFSEIYKRISKRAEKVSLVYESDLEKGDMATLLNQSLSKDRVLQFTSVGVHKDDLGFYLDDVPIKKIGSQGQQKTFVISLKLAQFEYLHQQNGFKPILLLDDIFDKLDEQRVEALVQMVNEHRFGQIFITDTHPERTKEVIRRVNEESVIYLVDEGTISPMSK
jgi:DNA replication and repair protein RecF